MINMKISALKKVNHLICINFMLTETAMLYFSELVNEYVT